MLALETLKTASNEDYTAQSPFFHVYVEKWERISLVLSKSGFYLLGTGKVSSPDWHC